MGRNRKFIFKAISGVRQRICVWLLMASGVLALAGQVEAAPPQLVVEPSRELLEFSNNEALFVFDQAMDTSALHIEWVGVPADQVTTEWVTIPFVPGAFQIKAAFTGPIAADTEVTWTLNPGNSNLIRSSLGEPLAEVSGSFTLPAIGGSNNGGGDCEDELITELQPTEGAVVFGRQYNYVQSDNGALVVDPEDLHTVGATVVGFPESPVSAATVRFPDGGTMNFLPFGIPGGPSSLVLGTFEGGEFSAPEYQDENLLNMAYPGGNYQVDLNPGLPGAQSFSFSVSDAGAVPQPSFTDIPAMKAADKFSDWTVSWTPFANAPATDRIELQIIAIDAFGIPETVYSAPNECEDISLTVQDSSHTIPAGVLLPGQQFRIELSYIRIDALQQNGEGEFDTFSGTIRTTVTQSGDGIVESTLAIASAVVDNGQFTLTLDGAIADNVTIYLLEKSVTSPDGDWQTVGIITKPVLDNLGGEPYKYSEAVSGDQAFFRLIRQ